MTHIKFSSTCFLLTVDVEDWFQVENFKDWIPFDSWPSRELRVEGNTHRLLDLLDSIKLNVDAAKNPIIPGHKIKATFFILGWIAERLPGLVREIHNRGHEVASHGYDHHLASVQEAKDLKDDLIKSKKLLEDTIGSAVFGYRAPSFSIDDNILKIIEDCGYLYDSSFNSFAMHGRYGKVRLTDNNRLGIAIRVSDAFYELPISNAKICSRILPLGGGAYFRLLPFPLFKYGIERILEKEKAYLFYMHPWELDPEQPKVDEASIGFKFRHYVNLKNNYSKLTRLLNEFTHSGFMTCRQYLDEFGK